MSYGESKVSLYSGNMSYNLTDSNGFADIVIVMNNMGLWDY